MFPTPITTVNKRGRTIKPSSRYTSNNSIAMPFGRLTVPLEEPAKATKAARPAPRVYRNPHIMRMLPSESESSSDDDDDSLPPLITLDELKRRQDARKAEALEKAKAEAREKKANARAPSTSYSPIAYEIIKHRAASEPMNAAKTETGEGWLSADCYRHADGSLDLIVEDTPFESSTTRAGWIAPGMYRCTNGRIDIDCY